MTKDINGNKKDSKKNERFKNEGLLHTPLETGIETPLTTPVDVGHLSGGEFQQIHSSGQKGSQ